VNTLRRPVDFLVPGVLALAVMSTAMVSLGIATGFERRYGVLKRLGSTPLSRGALLVAKTIDVLVVELLQAIVIVLTGLALGWDPDGSIGLALVVLLIGTVAFAGLGMLMAGTLRAEATLAVANGLFLLLLFLDEPTAGMDPHARVTTWRLIRALRDDGVTIVLTTHAMDEAEQLCDQLAIIDRGRAVATGTPDELTHDGSATVRFAAPARLPDDELATRLRIDRTAVHEPQPGEYVLDVEGSPEVLAELTAWLRDRGAQLTALRAGRRTLEEVFLELTDEGPQ